MKKLITLSFPVFFLLIFACSGNVESECNYSKIDSLMYSAIKDSVFPGGVLLFGIYDTVLYNKAFGNYTYSKSSPKISTNSLFDLASVTKVVATTSAAMLLVDNKKIKLDDYVVNYLPEFNNNGKNKITIKHLLLHNSGLPAFKKYYDIYSTEDEVVSDIMQSTLDYPPGQKFVYSDLGMITLQKVIERVSGQSLEKFLIDNLFTQLEMNHTIFNPSNEMKNRCVPTEIDTVWRHRLIQGEVHDERAALLNGVAGHAGLFSTAEDLAKFVIMLNNKGKVNDKQIISEKIIDEWTTKQTEQSDRALGWDTKSPEGYSSAGKYFSDESFGHTGFTGTSIWVDKRTKVFVILLTNRVYPSRANRKIVKFRPIIHDEIYKTLIDCNEL